MKISSPRRQAASTPAARLPVRSAARVADNTRPIPASHKNIGAAKPPRIVAWRNAIVERPANRVHASSVCASIITSTAMPRAQSM